MISTLNLLHAKPSNFTDVGLVDAKGVWTAQVGQDITISRLFQNRNYQTQRPYFVDLAANHPVHLSNTRSLERDFGWEGLCIEANKDLIQELVERRVCAVANAIVANGGRAAFRAAADDGFGYAKKVNSNSTNGTQTTLLLTDLLKQAHAPKNIQYLSLDVEGFEDNVLLNFPFRRPYHIESITVERPSLRLRSYLKSNGYEYVFDHGWFGDSFWVHSSLPEGVSFAKEVAKQSVKEWGRTNCRVVPRWMKTIIKKNVKSAGEWARFACENVIVIDKS